MSYYNYGYAPQHNPYGRGPPPRAPGYPGYPIYGPGPTSFNQPPQAAPVPFIPPGAMVETPTEQPQPLDSKHRSKRSHRAATTPLPLKSALKKTGATPGPAPAIPLDETAGERPRKASKPRKDKHVAAAAAVAVAAAPNPEMPVPTPDKTESYHMFVTFKGDSELLLENTLDYARKDIEEQVLRLWRPGLESSQFRASNWTIRFKNGPWNMAGPDVSDAWELVVALFTLFAKKGFNFMTSTKTTTTQPRLIFQAADTNKHVHFFLAFMSRGGRRATLIKPPTRILTEFGPRIQASLANVDLSFEGELVIAEVRREIGGASVKPSFYLMQVLKALMDLGYDLNATVPMARGGPLGMGERRELLVFKVSSRDGL
ncbi:hypothetical protein MKEN_00819900 [Mycena kentingensis (nom. inval.)]|nr:hypothetical protein MKEN_00819900 [Mycena kentingensis (nom. inval.)]